LTSADPIYDPITAVTQLVATVDPALDYEQIRRIVERVGGGRAKRRRLAKELADNRSVLLTGRSPASKAVGELLLALRGTGSARISPPWCADCGREVTSMQRRSGNCYCSPCFERPEPCSACGQLRPVGFRDRHGGPRCAKCPDKDTRDPHHVLVHVITTIDAGPTESAVTAAIAKTAVKAAHVQKLAWTLEEAPELLTTDGAKAPSPMVLRLIDALCDAGPTVVRRPACPRCERVVALSKTLDGQRICRNCAAKANAVPCARCGTIREPATRDEHGKPLCPNCLVSDPVNLESCIRCRRRRRVHLRSPDGPVCGTCTPRTTAVCSMCGRTAPCTTSKTTGRTQMRRMRQGMGTVLSLRTLGTGSSRDTRTTSLRRMRGPRPGNLEDVPRMRHHRPDRRRRLQPLQTSPATARPAHRHRRTDQTRTAAAPSDPGRHQPADDGAELAQTPHRQSNPGRAGSRRPAAHPYGPRRADPQ